MKSVFPPLLVIALVFLSLFFFPVALAIEAEWTPNEADDGPLPLSQAQRQQLLQLDQTISQSGDPEKTLAQVAEANGMSPDELATMLMRNRKDMQMAGGGGSAVSAASTLPRRILGLIWSVVMLVARSARVHPKSFSIIAMSLLAVMYISVTAPRTGIVMSTSTRPLLSSGHTTFLDPPSRYISYYLGSDRYGRLQSSLPKKVKIGSISRRLGEDVPALEEDGVTIEKLGRKSALAFAITARKSVSIDSLLPDNDGGGGLDDDETNGVDDDDEEKGKTRDEVRVALELAYESAVSVLSARRFSEFVSNQKALRFHPATLPSSRDRDRRMDARSGVGEKEGAAIIMKSLGDLRRYGIQPLRVAYEEDAVGMKSVSFYTLRGGHFDGEIKFSVERKRVDEDEEGGEGILDDDIEEDGVVVVVTLAVPKKGRKLNKNLAKKMVSMFADSITKSTILEAKQSLAHSSQSQRYRGRAKSRAVERRHTRFEQEKKQEEMAEDRRRKWQRANPDAGRYRPSGHRMRSPNNC